jgi:uncharacterized protein YycO
MSITVVFTRSKNIGSYLIRKISWSEWSHCAIVDYSSNTVIEATWPQGVIERPLEEFLAQHTTNGEVCFRTYKGDKRVVEYCRSQVGKPYDTLGVLGVGIHREWQDDSKWWCNELIEAGLVKYGYSPYIAANLRRLTPQHRWIVK